MSMTMQTVLTVAAELRDSRPAEPRNTMQTPEIQTWRQWILDCECVADGLRGAYPPGFDRRRFLAECFEGIGSVVAAPELEA